MKVNYRIIVFFASVLFLCLACSKSGNRLRGKTEKTENRVVRKSEARTQRTYRNKKTVIQMKKEGGIYKIPVEINGVPMEFIFDTGASIISISETEARFLTRQGTLTENDFIRKAKFTDAKGEVSEGTIVNLKTVKLGRVVLENVEASIVHNPIAPLLLGQSALAKFGKISIDYNKNRLTLE